MAASIGAAHASLAISITPTVGRQEYLDYMTFQSDGPAMFTELFGPIVGLKEEWLAQGATPQELDLSAFRYRTAKARGIPVYTGWIGGTDEEILEDNDKCIVYRDSRGRTMKLIRGYASIALPLDYPVANMDDWLRLKHHYEFSEERFGRDWEQAARSAIEEDCATVVGIPGGFDEPRQLMGEESLCIAYYEQPELIHDMLKTIGDTAVRVLDRVSSAVRVDELGVHEDMAGKSGSLAGPSQISEFIAPYYRRVWDMLMDRGARLFSQDSDGFMEPVIPAFLDAGINLMYPMEPAAGMDIVKLRRRFGNRLAFKGGIDKHVLRRSKDEIEAELQYKIPPMLESGGCILGLDHRIPNGTPLENYRFYIGRVWEMIEEYGSGS